MTNLEDISIEEFDKPNFEQYVGCWLDDSHLRIRNTDQETAGKLMHIALMLGTPKDKLPNGYDQEGWPLSTESEEKEEEDWWNDYEHIIRALNNHLKLDTLFWGWIDADEDSLCLFGLWPKGTERYPDGRWQFDRHNEEEKNYTWTNMDDVLLELKPRDIQKSED